MARFATLALSPSHPSHFLPAPMQPGTEMVAAGYCMYGSMSYMMITTGKGVAGFTLDPTLGGWLVCVCGRGQDGKSGREPFVVCIWVEGKLPQPCCLFVLLPLSLPAGPPACPPSPLPQASS